MSIGCDQVLSELVQNITCTQQPFLLDPAESFSCSGGYVLTQQDVDEGTVSNEVASVRKRYETNRQYDYPYSLSDEVYLLERR